MSVSVGRIFESVCMSVCLSVCRHHNSKTNDPKVVLGPILRFYTLSAPSVQHRFDVFFYILGLWANDFKTLTKNKSVRKSYYRTVFDMTISA